MIQWLLPAVRRRCSTIGSLSSAKLKHEKSRFKLHSHQIPYGTGSGQRSVTAVPAKDDTNSLWLDMNTPLQSMIISDLYTCSAPLYHLTVLLTDVKYSWSTSAPRSTFIPITISRPCLAEKRSRPMRVRMMATTGQWNAWTRRTSSGQESRQCSFDMRTQICI